MQVTPKNPTLPEEENDLSQVYTQLKANVEVKDHSHFFTTYKNSFLGRDMVAYMISSGLAKDTEEATILGNLLIGGGFIVSVTKEQVFRSDNSFYKFEAEGSKNGANLQVNGKNISLWQQFATTVGSSVHQSTFSGNSDFSYIASLPPQETAQGLEMGLSEADMRLMCSIPPVDSHNVHLLDNVHPSAWGQPREKEAPYDMLVIGGGAGGLVSSIGTQMMGGSVALVEDKFLGGDCTNFGCVPSKALIRSAHVAKLCQT